MWMLLERCSYNERLQVWYQSTFWVERSSQKISSKSIRRTQTELHTSFHLQYTIDRAARVNQLNIKEHAPGRMFKHWAPQCLIPLNFLCGEEMPKICSKSVCRTQRELRTSLPIWYTIAVNQWGCSWPDVRRMNAYKFGTSQHSGWRGVRKK